MTYPTVNITRDFDASRERVFDAWLDPMQVCAWMSPGVSTAADIEPRIGGAYRVHHTRDGQDVGGFEATITGLDPPRRIVWDWGFVGPGDRRHPIESILEVTLDALDEHRTRLFLVHRRLDDLHRLVPHVADNVESGWSQVLGQLAAGLGAHR